MARIRTGFSFRSAFGHIPDVMSRVVAAGLPCAPITDRASTFGWVAWSKAAKSANLKPVFGVELAVTASIHAKKPVRSYWTFLSKDSVFPVNRLLKSATEQFRYEPLLTYEQAIAADEVIKIVGSTALLEEIPEGCEADPDLFIELSPSCSRGFVRAAQKRGFKFIACSDNRFPLPEDKAAYEILCGQNASVQSYPQWILDDAAWTKDICSRTRLDEQDAVSALLARDQSLARCNAKLPVAQLLTPDKPKSLRQLCVEGAEKIGIDLGDGKYSARLDHELAMIETKQYEDYFFIIADLMKFARANLLCGPARGSSCGSLVCYLLEITTIDPLKFGLIFERFIDITRNDLPDIDIDFNDEKRHLLFEYAKNKYGSDHVARLGTVAMYRPKSAINETAAALQIPKWKTESVIESMILRSSGDSRAMQMIEDTMSETRAGQSFLAEFPEMRIASRLEGHPRHHSQHAAGIVITQRPVLEYVAIDDRTGATMCDKKDAEELNLLKIDALGLTQLSIFEDALELAGLPRLFLESLHLDDQKAFDVLNNRNWSGVFQFNGNALQSLASQVKIRDIEDIISITALARPGPLTSGGAGSWAARHNGKEPVVYPHPLFKPYLEKTLGVTMYQEQVMEIGRNIGGLSWEDVTALRKAMSKSLGKEYFDQFGDRWKAGAVAKGIPAEPLVKIWDDLCAYGAWCFNRSHSVAYGLISYWCCWLKAHHPHEFAAAMLTHEGDPDKQIKLLRELDAAGIKYLPVDPATSTERWRVTSKDGQRFLVGPLTGVKGLGPKSVNAILSARARNEPIPERAEKLLRSPKTAIDSVWPIRDAFSRLLPDPSARNIHTPPVAIESIAPLPVSQEVLVFCTFVKINPRNENEAINVAKRGGKLIEDGLTTSLNLQAADDTGQIFCKISRFDYARLGVEIVNRGNPGKALYAVKGWVRENFTFRMISVKAVRFIGMLSDQTDQIKTKEAA